LVFTCESRVAKVGIFSNKISLISSGVNCSLSKCPISAMIIFPSASKKSWYFTSAVTKISAFRAKALPSKKLPLPPQTATRYILSKINLVCLIDLALKTFFMRSKKTSVSTGESKLPIMPAPTILYSFVTG